MHSNSENPEVQSLTSHSDAANQVEQPHEQALSPNLPVYNSYYPGQPSIPSYSPFANSKQDKNQAYLPPHDMHSYKPEELETHQQHSVHQIPGFQNHNIREGEVYAYYVKDGAAYLKPYNGSSSSAIFPDWLVKFDNTMKENAFPYYRIFLYLSTIISILNIVPSLIFMFVYGHVSFVFGFILAIWMTIMGISEISAVYHKKTIKGGCQMATTIAYTIFYFLTIVVFALDDNTWRGR